MTDTRRHGAFFRDPAPEDGAHTVASVMIAGHGINGHGQIGQRLIQHVIGAFVAAVGQIAGNDNGIGLAGQAVQIIRHDPHAGRRIHLAKGKAAVAAQVQIRNLQDLHNFSSSRAFSV